MFSLGFYEWVVIIAAVILFVKPEDYPKLFKAIGKGIRKIEVFWKNVSNQIDYYD